MIIVKRQDVPQRPYCDSVYVYDVESDEPEAQVREHCLKNVHRVNPGNERRGDSHGGHCGFPFGLEPYYSFSPLGVARFGVGRYRFSVTVPYCD